MVAVHANKAGDKAQAVAFLQAVKQLQQAAQSLECSVAVDMSQLPPANPLYVQPQKATGSGEAAKAAKRAQFEKLSALWQEKIKALNQEAMSCKNTNKAKAVELHRQQKQFMQQLSTLRTLEADPTARCPRYHVETVERQEERVFSHLTQSELEITIVNCKGLCLKGYGSLCCFVYGEVQIGSYSGLINTPCITATNPEFNFTVKMNLERKKSTQIFFEHKKVVLHVYHKRTLLPAIELGRFFVPFADLLTKAESCQVTPILRPDSRREVASATAEVRLRLQTPLLKKDMVTITEHSVVLDEPLQLPNAPAASPAQPPKPQPNAAKAPAQQPTAKPQQNAAEAKPLQKPQLNPQPPLSKPQPPLPKPQPPQPKPQPAAEVKNAAEAVGDDEIDAESLDRVVSNDVLEWEQDRVTRQLAAAKVAGKALSEDMVVRKQDIEVKMQLLVIQVQTGKITPEGYIKMLEAAVKAEHEVARRLVGLGRKEQAVVPLQRVKIMQKEIASASEEDGEE
eukprot:TRINITY_DN3936_c0_g1_i3.p1 TRINITY_DN3936_c0_g1~~TRINITY_DN3936_c0_g1_i3.p1  ORF type:complete len:510 (-),score=180.18 TRINITY_DN3936_c0_g1_i3:64-1593(-)